MQIQVIKVLTDIKYEWKSWVVCKSELNVTCAQ